MWRRKPKREQSPITRTQHLLLQCQRGGRYQDPPGPNALLLSDTVCKVAYNARKRKREDVSTNMTGNLISSHVTSLTNTIKICVSVANYFPIWVPGFCQHLGECASHCPTLILCQCMDTSKHSTTGAWTGLFDKKKTSQVLLCAPNLYCNTMYRWC